jgi:hypothetical protein
MLSAKVTLTASPGLAEALERVRALTAGEASQAGEAMAAGVEQTTRRHVLALGTSRHDTALSLGASPTGFLANAAGTVQAHATTDGVELTMQRAGLSRALRDYDLRPIRSRLLTIPLTAESYGRRAREFSGLKWRSFSAADVAAGKSDRAGLVLGQPPEAEGGMFHALFAGARRAFIPQDRTLLPEDEDWLDSLEAAAWDYLDLTGN